MKELAQELHEYGLSEEQIIRIFVTLHQGKTVRTTYTTEIDSIFINDNSLAEMTIFDRWGAPYNIVRKWK